MISDMHEELLKNNIDTIILKSLYKGDSSSDEIFDEIMNKSSNQYLIKKPTLTAVLKRLEDQGFISSYMGSKSFHSKKKYFTLTQMGRDLYIKNQTQWEYSRTIMDKLISENDFDINSLPPVRNDNIIKFKKRKKAKKNVAYNNIIENTTSTKEIPNPSSIKDYQDKVTNNLTIKELLKENNKNNFFNNITSQNITPNLSDSLEKETQSEIEKINDEKKLETEKINDEKFTNEIVTIDNKQNKNEIIKNDKLNEYSLNEINVIDNLFHKSDNPSTTKKDLYKRKSALFFDNNNNNYRSKNLKIDENKAYILREYKNILSKIIPNHDFVSEQINFQQPNIETLNQPQLINQSFNENLQSVNNNIYNNEIQIREKQNIINDENFKNNNKVEEKTIHNQDNDYFYANKLLITHYFVLFIAMILEISICAFAIKIKTRKDLLCFILVSLVSVGFPIFAAINFFKYSDKISKFKNTILNEFLIRLIFSACLVCIIVCLNILIPGLSEDGFKITSSTVILPILLSIDIVLSYLIFVLLYKSKKFNV